jgi:hypothetical protein
LGGGVLGVFLAGTTKVFASGCAKVVVKIKKESNKKPRSTMGVRSTRGGGVRVVGTADLFLPEAEVGISDIQ